MALIIRTSELTSLPGRASAFKSPCAVGPVWCWPRTQGITRWMSTNSSSIMSILLLLSYWSAYYFSFFNRIEVSIFSSSVSYSYISIRKSIVDTKFSHISSVMFNQLHCLPLSARIEFKIVALVLKSKLGVAPKYLRDHIRSLLSATSRRPLRSLDRRFFLSREFGPPWLKLDPLPPLGLPSGMPFFPLA